MFVATDYDPVFLAQVRHRHPTVWPNHRRFVQLADADDRSRLERLDAELDELCARRLAVLSRLDRHRDRLWPRADRRRVRRPGSLGDAPCPPAPVDARPVCGVGLRHVMVTLLRRHGPVTLRELHGLLHRYGYVIESDRPVQRLGDAAAYEVRRGRLRRHGRGVYGPGDQARASEADSARSDATDVPPEPLPWSTPQDDLDGAPIDPAVASDPERWSDQRWPASAQVGSDSCPGRVEPRIRRTANDLQVTTTATRERLARLIEDHLGPPPPRIHNPRPTTTPAGPAAASPSVSDDSSTNRRQWRGRDAWWWGGGDVRGEGGREDGEPDDGRPPQRE